MLLAEWPPRRAGCERSIDGNFKLKPDGGKFVMDA